MDPIYVTQPFLPELKEFIPYLEQIWENKILTNSGPMHKELEKKLAEYLGVKFVCLFNNGTNALFTALQALELTGEIITTPYSFIATTHSIMWNKLTPVFVDIDPETLNLDPNKIEAAITDKTTAIMPVHCYGNPCDVAAIEAVAKKHKLKILYDAAHAFGVKNSNNSVLNYGDLSVLSFHATKVFNTFEGGAIICHTEEMYKKINQLKNFGIISETEAVAVGSNGKMNEVSAAFGLLQLRYIDDAIEKRRVLDNRYRKELSDVKGVYCLPFLSSATSSYSYFPVLITEEYSLTRDELYQKLKENNIFARRYFYPLISDFEMYKDLPSSSKENLPVAKKASDQVLCLPIYAALEESDQQRIIEVIL